MHNRTENSGQFWWIKQDSKPVDTSEGHSELVSSSLADFLQKEKEVLQLRHEEDNSKSDSASTTDIASIIDEINRVAAQSPLGPYNPELNDSRSLSEILSETKKAYIAGSKSFEQLSQISLVTDEKEREKMKVDVCKEDSSSSTISMNFQEQHDEDQYSDSFSTVTNSEVNKPQGELAKISEESQASRDPSKTDDSIDLRASGDFQQQNSRSKIVQNNASNSNRQLLLEQSVIASHKVDGFDVREENKRLKEANKRLQYDLDQISVQLEKTKATVLLHNKHHQNRVITPSSELNVELERTLEELKDSKELNTALQLQLDTLTTTHYQLKSSYEDVQTNNTSLQRKFAEFEFTQTKYRNELNSVQKQLEKSIENESNYTKQLEFERNQSKTLKTQTEKDAKLILDLNRQIKEMERIIISRKYSNTDTVSNLLNTVALKSDNSLDSNVRKILEDRIKVLESQVSNRDQQSTNIFVDVQEKFNQMKVKYESHINDLEVHVNDLKEQLKANSLVAKSEQHVFDVYTQTKNVDRPNRDSKTVSCQTDANTVKNTTTSCSIIKNLRSELVSKNKIVQELKAKEKSLEKLIREYETSSRFGDAKQSNKTGEDELKMLRQDRDRLKQQLVQYNENYEALKMKRLHDLNALQQVHEQELTKCQSNSTPLREQVELQQVTITTLQQQLSSVKEELAVLQVERDYLNTVKATANGDASIIDSLNRKITILEKRYEEREFRLRAILQGLAQKTVPNRQCEQCSERQKQLVGYKLELDQLLASVRALKP